MSNFDPSPPQIYQPQPQPSKSTNPDGDFVVKFWGVRGLIATPGSKTTKYGGNTACVEICVAGKHLIFDGGTGLRCLGKEWEKLQTPIEAHLFFTNSQSNRLQGFPFFAPAFLEDHTFHIYGIAATNGASIKQCLGDQMLQPNFPFPLQIMQSELQFYSVIPHQPILIDDVKITTALINQNQKSLGYRVNWQGLSVAYVTDLSACSDEAEITEISQLIAGVDLLIANAAYTVLTPRSQQETEFYWQTAVDLANTVGAKQLVVSHHHPDDWDDSLDKMQIQLTDAFPNSLLAYEGLAVVLGKIQPQDSNPQN
jgi:phosphoribosyl 1,2-cyclic phosphodiesterase